MNRKYSTSDIENFLLQGVAFVPENVRSEGNRWTMMFRDGQSLPMNVSGSLFLKYIAEHFEIDLEAMRKKYEEKLGIKQSPPFPIAPYFTLVQFNIRKPLGIGNQVAYGYFVLERISGAREVDRTHTEILMEDQQKVVIRHSEKSYFQRLCQAFASKSLRWMTQEHVMKQIREQQLDPDMVKFMEGLVSVWKKIS